MSDKPPFYLRPFHPWFFFWDGLISSIYRVLAVAVGAAITAAVLVSLAPIRWLVALPVSLVAWIGLAIAQDHDQGVRLPVDPEFSATLEEEVSPVLATRGYGPLHASGPVRARNTREESYTYWRPDADDMVSILRDPVEQRLTVSRWDQDDSGGSEMLTLTGDAQFDVAALVSVLRTL